jgi:Saxitoxin biosynthesis operon protein SxtJ
MNNALDPRSGKHAEPKMGSERNFGLVFAVVFAFIALWPLVRADKIHLWALAISAVFLIAAFIAPRVLAPLNRLWFQIGILLGKVVTPVVMGILFLVAVTPVGFIMRLFGKDPLKLKRELTAKSYWIERSPPGPAAGSLKDQF